MSTQALAVLSKDALLSKQERLEARLRSVRTGMEKRAENLEGAAVGVVAAYLMGAWQAKAAAQGESLPTIGGLDPALVYGFVGYFAGSEVKGPIGMLLKNGGYGVLCGAAFDAGQKSRLGQGTKAEQLARLQPRNPAGAPAGGQPAAGANANR